MVIQYHTIINENEYDLDNIGSSARGDDILVSLSADWGGQSDYGHVDTFTYIG